MALLQQVPLSALRVEDEHDFAGISLYGRLKRVLLDAGVQYRVVAAGSELARWDHVLLLNHGFWSPEQPDDVLEGRVLTADVVAHRAWHHLVAQALGGGARSVEGLMVGESIASAFDAYMLGSLLRDRPRAAMLETQMPAMTDAMSEAGLSEGDCSALLTRFADDPHVAFKQLMGLLYEVGTALCHCEDAEAAAAVLVAASSHPLAPLLHHYQVANWVLYSRAYASEDADGSTAAALAAELLSTEDPLSDLVERWL